MKILFLDIDGVLNSRQYDRQKAQDDGNIDPTRLKLVAEILAQTGARVVLTSTWRLHWCPDGASTDGIGRELQAFFASHGVELYDKTPILGDRAKEVGAWLDAHPEVTHFAILDDIKFGWGELDSHVIKTDYLIGRGLMEKHVSAAIALLQA